MFVDFFDRRDYERGALARKFPEVFKVLDEQGYFENEEQIIGEAIEKMIKAPFLLIGRVLSRAFTWIRKKKA